MNEVEKSQLLQQVSVILQQCQLIVSRLSSPAPAPVVCQCQSSSPSSPSSSDHNNYWWDDYTSELSQFKSEFYSLLSPDFDDLFEDDDNDTSIKTKPPVFMSSSIVSRSSSGFGSSGDGLSTISSNGDTCGRKCECYNQAGCDHVTGECQHPPGDSSQRQGDRRHPVVERKCQDDIFQSRIFQFLSTCCPNGVYSKNWREDGLKSALLDPEFLPLWTNYHLLFQDVLEEDEYINFENFSPEIRYNTIDLSNVNARFIENIPKPSYIAIQGVSQDPDFYQKLYPRNDYYKIEKFYKFHEPYPFGGDYGYETNIGVVPPPTDPIHGYIWQGCSWKLHAVEPGQGRSITRRRRG